MSQSSIIMCFAILMSAVALIIWLMGRSLKAGGWVAAGRVTVGLSYALAGFNALVSILILTGV